MIKLWGDRRLGADGRRGNAGIAAGWLLHGCLALRRVSTTRREHAIMPVFCPTGQLWDASRRSHRRDVQTLEMTNPGYCAWGCFSSFCLELPSPTRGEGTATDAAYSQYHVEKSFSNCGTSFQTPFSFLAVMVMSCGWNR